MTLQEPRNSTLNTPSTPKTPEPSNLEDPKLQKIKKKHKNENKSAVMRNLKSKSHPEAQDCSG